MNPLRVLTIVLTVFVAVTNVVADDGEQQLAQEILTKTGVKGA